MFFFTLESYKVKRRRPLAARALCRIFRILLNRRQLLHPQHRGSIFGVQVRALESNPFRMQKGYRGRGDVELLSEIRYGLAVALIHRAANSELIRFKPLITNVSIADRGCEG